MKLKMAAYKLPAQPMPAMEGWTGRDIDNCARKADTLGITLVEAAKYIVPLMRSHAEEMDNLRQSAHDRFLSSSNEGVYQYSKPTINHTPSVKVSEGRKMR